MLRIENLTVEAGGKTILTDVNLEIKDGEKMALLGPNGSGKTSLIMTIMGLSEYRIKKGVVVFGGKKINDMPPNERARLGIGMMFQRPPTVRGIRLRHMVNAIKKEKSFRIEEEAENLNLKEFLDRDINLDFSGGELKRSELLQLIASSPDLGLFDEPESGVDIENMELVGNIMNRILNKKKGNSALIITHTGYIFDYVEPDRGCIMVGGGVHCVGEPRGILETVRKHGYEWCVSCKRKSPIKRKQKK